MALSLVIPIFGPPAAGKTTLTVRLGEAHGRTTFRLREHVSKQALAATAASSEQLGWIDDFTVADALRAYFTTVHSDPAVHTVMLDNFPGSGIQVDQLLAILWALTPTPHIEAVEVVTDAKTLKQRARTRKVCHQCERDPIHDPRLPAMPSAGDPWQCARCGGLLHPRRGDSPRLFRARLQRYHQAAEGIRAGFTRCGITVTQLDTTNTIEGAAELLAPLLISRSPIS
ncbi:AAA family ATPase [Nocardia huaxiensis]|uniref:AAA family ATPase n=1 Tax=Nocardia huaxiensis TaxID=2755382 RepID=A0A7D6Z1L5_9NOCA|nr:AAA family ATPase [Nocardia huaxiensis]QLY30406.1 AAA family ATPase [Nocardia huaxiensis]